VSRSPVASSAAAGALIAPAARQWLTGLTAGRVLHTFEAAAYLVDQDGGVLLLARPPLGPGPFTLVLESSAFDFQAVLTVGEGVSSSAGELVAEGWRVDATSARVWNPRPAWETLRRRGSSLREGLDAVRQAVLKQGPRGPFGRLLTGSAVPTAVDTIEDRLEARAREGATRLAGALASGPRGQLEMAAAELAGLGSGFTPSGDDFLMGAMFAQWTTRPAAAARRLSGVIAKAASPRTTTVSAAWLQAAARGEASLLWHALVDALAAGDEARIAKTARGILETGHTSGEDAIAGFLHSIEPGL
jgi:hypothetical protein